MGFVASKAYEVSAKCKEVKAKTQERMQLQMKQFEDTPSNQKMMAELMLIWEKACGTKFGKLYFSDDLRDNVVDEADWCQPLGLHPDCTYGDDDLDNR
ncbi:hypothetical protein L596_007639 [Steinernema carpocapsae]|uniref:Uncharacterized protein n=1 Tax=Steinernema carpocapsae TaxID=34508 RepID=A0A4V6A622_STECR|nr:hypothetical protein L596_007639 [Steinernema carpocapsae]